MQTLPTRNDSCLTSARWRLLTARPSVDVWIGVQDQRAFSEAMAAGGGNQSGDEGAALPVVDSAVHRHWLVAHSRDRGGHTVAMGSQQATDGAHY